jgi:ribosomal protein L11 methyltransferase
MAVGDVIIDAVTQELRLHVAPKVKDDFADYLLELGLSGYVEGSLDCDITFEYGPDHLHHDYYVDNDQGRSPFVFYSVDKAELEETLLRIRQGLTEAGIDPAALTVEWGELAEASWKESWKESFRPLRIADELVVLPPWEPLADHPAPLQIVIDPGMAFGTGQHETTQLCLGLYLSKTARRFERVLDVGTGSGILAIAADKCGCPFVLGCDIDPDSVRIAKENAVLNGVPEIGFTADPLEHISASGFDLIFANITARPLMSLLDGMAAKAALGACLVTSGVLATEEEEFTVALRAAGFFVTERQQAGDWIGLIARFGS